MPSDGQDIDQWKQKYYDQLDTLEKKEHEWESLESILKRTISRLSLAAEGQNSTLDRHLTDLRGSIKHQINPQKLEVIVDSISSILTQLEEKQASTDHPFIDMLRQLVTQLEWPKQCLKSSRKLQRSLDKATDDDRQQLLKETIDLLKLALSTTGETDKEKGSLLGKLFQSDTGHTSTDSIQESDSTQIKLLASVLGNILGNLPWPDSVQQAVQNIIKDVDASSNIEKLNSNLKQLEPFINQWPSDNNSMPQVSSDNIKSYRHCLLDILNYINNANSPNGKLSAINVATREATNQLELEELCQQLSTLVTLHSADNNTKTVTSLNTEKDKTDSSDNSEPGIQELLIRLLEQLIVPAELQQQTEQMKSRLEQQTSPENWKQLLKDVATLINSIRSHLQKEKTEFETFLHQVTDRLKAMDQFLQTETESLQAAENKGNEFDLNIHNNVDEIRQDVDDAVDLNNLKQTVSTKLDVITNHIKLYRDSEKQRLHNSQQQLDSMHNRMQELENETQTLKKVVVEKNKQAMFDALTGIPNRLSYEKKIEEEVARWKRFSNPLSLAVWDIDFFKKVNDTYGHKAGDKVLKTVAQLLNKRIRETDFLARYGGEEFVMLLPGTKQEETLRLVNSLREEVQNCGFHYHGDAVKITVSCGVSSFNEGDTVNNVFERADKALYKAKHNGRNQCIIASSLSD